MNDSTHWTPFPEDNLLGLTDKTLINEHEARGIVNAEIFVLELDEDTKISTNLILEIHRTAFEEIYDWAGKWRTTQVVVGQLQPPMPNQVLQFMYQFVDNLNYKISIAKFLSEQVKCLVFAHYEFIKIHPFVNGNGRTGRILMNLVGIKLGFQPLELYHREGEGRSIYINAMKLGDMGDFSKLRHLITEEMTPF